MLRKFTILLFVTLISTLKCRVEIVENQFLNTKHKNLTEFSLENINATSTETQLVDEYEVSFAQDSIEPAQPTSLAGFGSIHRRLLFPNFETIGESFSHFAPYRSVDLPPRVKIFLLKAKNSAGTFSYFAFIVLDLVAISADMSQKIILMLREAYPQHLLSHQNIHVLASHTHSGPGGLSEHPFWAAVASDRYSENYFNFVSERIKNTYATAVGSLKSFNQVIASVANLDLNFSRTQHMKPDQRRINLSFVKKDEGTRGCLEFYSVHPVWYGSQDRILSADLTGHIEKQFETVLGKDQGCFFINASVGNADAVDSTGPEDYAKKYVTGSREKIIKPQDILGASGVKFRSKAFSVGKPQINEQTCTVEGELAFVNLKLLETLPQTSLMSTLSFGKIVFVLLPGEPDYAIRQAIETEIKVSDMNIEHVVTLGLADDYLGYFVTRNEYLRQSIESCSSLYGENLSRVITDNTADLFLGR